MDNQRVTAGRGEEEEREEDCDKENDRGQYPPSSAALTGGASKPPDKENDQYCGGAKGYQREGANTYEPHLAEKKRRRLAPPIKKPMW